ncbi:MAG: terminase small subunit [Acinetobacter sp.]
MCAATVGNSFWKQRSSHGRKPIFASPDDLWSAACEYFEWVEENPLMETKLFSYEGEIVEGEIPKMRAMTIQALCFFIGISRQGWSEYKAKQDFSYIVEQVEAVIFSQKFEGASGGFLNASIISRELGLADKQQLEHSGSIDTLTDEELNKRIAELTKAKND